MLNPAHLPPLGTPKSQLDTPVVCVDRDALEANVRHLLAKCREHGVQWRPHAKCHKSPLIARKLIDAGAIGVTCAKLGEAEVMAAGGVRDILIANIIVGPAKLDRLAALRQTADPIVCIDHAEHVRMLNQALAASPLPLRVLIEVDIGLHRVGVAPGAATLDLARQAAAAPHLRLTGIMGYEGHLLQIADQQEKATRIAEALRLLAGCADELRAAGLPCPIVSCGGTGSFFYSVHQPGITELQAGGGIFMDAFYRHLCGVSELRDAMTVLCTVVSRPAPDRAIIDAGRKTMDGTLHKPLVVGRDDIQVESLSAEHGKLRLAESAQGLRIGDRLELIPGYSDLTCVLHDYLYGIRGDRLEVIWPIAGRGCLQ